MKAKDYLCQVRKLDIIIENKKDEAEQLRDLAFSSSGGITDPEMKVQTSINLHKMEDTIIRYIDRQKKIEKDIDRLLNKKQSIIDTIESLESDEYDILHKMYIQYKNFDDIAEAYEKSYSWATTLHGRALKSLQHILDGREMNNGKK